MKKNILIFLAIAPFISCSNKGKDSVEIADSTNKEIQDSTLNTTGVVVDEKSTAFLVKVANSGIAETEMATMANQKAVYPSVREFAAMLFHDHSAVNETVKNMAAQKNVSLPTNISEDKQKDIDNLKKMTGKNLDKAFIELMIKNHEAEITLFDNAQLDTKDTDVRAFAGKTLPVLKAHLDSARTLKKMYW
jgi:putative membrane protein